MQLVVISYPYHYHITQLAIKHALANVDGILDVKVVWDDRTIAAPHANYIPFSKVCNLPPYIKGWYAQQIIKLNLHNVLKGDIFILDGDVLLNRRFYPKEYFYAPLMWNDSKNFSKIKAMLNINQYNFLNAPCMHVDTLWLEELNEYCMDLNEIYINTSMSNWAVEGEWPLSEWEILYTFLTEIKKINKTVLPFEFHFLETKMFEENFNSIDNFILNGRDNFSVDFYQKHNITINETLWKQIYGALV